MTTLGRSKSALLVIDVQTDGESKVAKLYRNSFEATDLEELFN